MTRDSVTVSADPKSHKTEIHIEGDPRYDPKLISQARKGQADYNRQALLGGPATPEALAYSHKLADQAHSHNAEQLAELARARRHPAPAHPEPSHEPQWTLPAVCPECGARVDQFVGPAAMHHTCKYCGSPWPLERVE